jgi:hypothetical protein
VSRREWLLTWPAKVLRSSTLPFLSEIVLISPEPAGKAGERANADQLATWWSLRKNRTNMHEVPILRCTMEEPRPQNRAHSPYSSVQYANTS